MGYFEHEILNELNIGESYTQRQLRIFIVENCDVVLISKSCTRFEDNSSERLKVLDIIEGYQHKVSESHCYSLPSLKNKIYIVE